MNNKYYFFKNTNSQTDLNQMKKLILILFVVLFTMNVQAQTLRTDYRNVNISQLNTNTKAFSDPVKMQGHIATTWTSDSFYKVQVYNVKGTLHLTFYIDNVAFKTNYYKITKVAYGNQAPVVPSTGKMTMYTDENLINLASYGEGSICVYIKSSDKEQIFKYDLKLY